MDSNIKRSLSYNDLSLFKQEFPISRSQSHKIIRFAGLKNICIFRSSDSPSRIASSRRYSASSEPEWSMISNFKEFLGFYGNAVALESLQISTNFLIGRVLVRNISYTKHLILWYSIDDWKSVQELFCTFETSVSASNSNFTGIDRFVFKINLDQITIHKMNFCIKYLVNDVVYWDNNHGNNYQVISLLTPRSIYQKM